MIEEKIIKPNFVKTLDTLYFAHYKTSEEIDELLKFGFHGFEGQFYRNIDELSKDNWKLHKQLISDGINPNEILKILRNDKIEKLMEISAQSNFDYNQGIEPSVYERCSFINYYVGLIDYAAFFGSIKCFKYLLINGANVEYTLENAVAGGNLEIIHLCEQNNASYKYIYETAIEFHRNEIFHYFYDNKVIEIEDLTGLGKICIQYNNYEIFSFLKEEGMEINEKIIKAAAKLGNIYFIENYSIYPKDLLIYAVKSGNTELVELLLKQKEIDVNAKNNELTPLICASEYGFIDIVKILIEHKDIKINLKNKLGITAIYKASESKNYDIVLLLLKNKKIFEDLDQIKKVLLNASKDGKLKVIQQILKHGKIDVNVKNKDDKTPLMFAAENGHLKVVQYLLNMKSIVYNMKDKEGTTALMYASLNGQFDIVKLLLEQPGIDIFAKNENGYSSFALACLSGNIKIVKLLQSIKGMNLYINNHKQEILSCMSAKSKEMIIFLFKQKNFNTYVDGGIALIYATKNIKVELAKFLIEKLRINYNAKNRDGRTALMYASLYNQIEIVKLLLEQKEIDINNKDLDGRTALMYASQSNRIEIVKLFLQQKDIDVNAKDYRFYFINSEFILINLDSMELCK